MEHTIQTEHVGTVDGHLAAIEDFDFEAVYKRLDGDRMERGNPLADETERPTNYAHAGDALELLLLWIWSKPDFDVAFNRFVSMSAVMRPELLDNMSYVQLAAKLGVTKACISKNALDFSRAFGLRFRRSHAGASKNVLMQAARFKKTHLPE